MPESGLNYSCFPGRRQGIPRILPVKDRAMKNKSLYYGFIAIIFFVHIYCSGEGIKEETGLYKSGSTASLLEDIHSRNINSPGTFSSRFDIEGIHKGKKFRSTGDILFNKEPRKVKVTFYDAIFKSPITVIAQDDKVIKLYFPIDKTVYIDNVKSIDLNNYSNIDIDYRLVADITAGQIPLIDDYTIKQGLAKKSEGSVNQETVFIILENREYYETVSFILDKPDKIKWTQKQTKETTELYLEDPFQADNRVFYRRVRLVSQESLLKITIQFRDLKLDVPYNPEKITKIELPKDCKEVYMK